MIARSNRALPTINKHISRSSRLSYAGSLPAIVWITRGLYLAACPPPRTSYPRDLPLYKAYFPSHRSHLRLITPFRSTPSQEKFATMAANSDRDVLPETYVLFSSSAGMLILLCCRCFSSDSSSIREIFLKGKILFHAVVQLTLCDISMLV